MFLKILTAFIILFVVMLVIGLIRGKGRTKASAGDAARETRKLQSFDDMIAEYEREPDHGSITRGPVLLLLLYDRQKDKRI